MLKRPRWAELTRRSDEVDRAVISAMLGTLIVLDGSGEIVALNRPPKSPSEGNAWSLGAGERVVDCTAMFQHGSIHPVDLKENSKAFGHGRPERLMANMG